MRGLVQLMYQQRLGDRLGDRLRCLEIRSEGMAQMVVKKRACTPEGQKDTKAQLRQGALEGSRPRTEEGLEQVGWPRGLTL